MAVRYKERIVLLIGLLPERDPNLLEFCRSHASRLTPPVGWELLDERPKVKESVVITIPEPAPSLTA